GGAGRAWGAARGRGGRCGRRRPGALPGAGGGETGSWGRQAGRGRASRVRESVASGPAAGGWGGGGPRPIGAFLWRRGGGPGEVEVADSAHARRLSRKSRPPRSNGRSVETIPESGMSRKAAPGKAFGEVAGMRDGRWACRL